MQNDLIPNKNGTALVRTDDSKASASRNEKKYCIFV